jgi:hypothetical protein
MKNEKTAIQVIDNYIFKCDEIISWLDDGEWMNSVVGTGEISPIRTSMTRYVPFLSYSNPDTIQQMNKTVWNALDEYAKKWNFSFSYVEDVSIQRYQIGQKYNLHSDAGESHSNRVVSAIVYLNTVKKGGETSFPYVETAINPVEGRLAIFPANYVYAHEALPPISEIKYAAAYWATF